MIEVNHYFKQDSPLVLKPKEFKKIILDHKIKYITLIEIINLHQRIEVMIPSFNVKPRLIGISIDKIIKIIRNSKTPEEAKKSILKTKWKINKSQKMISLIENRKSKEVYT